MKKRTEAVGDAKTLEDRVAAIETYLNKDIRERKERKKLIRQAKRKETNPSLLSKLNALDDTDNEQELGV